MGDVDAACRRQILGRLSKEVKAKSRPREEREALRRELGIQDLMRVYNAAKAIQGTVKLEQVVDATYVQAALKEFGR